MGIFAKSSPDQVAVSLIARHLDRIATALEVIVRQSYGINLSPDTPDLSLEISYTDPDEIDEIESRTPRPMTSGTPSIGDEDSEPEPEPDTRVR